MSPIRERLEAGIDRLFPGMGFRPFYLTVFCSFAMLLYWHQGRQSAAPERFLELSERLFGIDDRIFHEHLWAHFSAVVLLMLIPLMLGWWAEGWRPRDLGLRIQGAGQEMLVVFLMWVVMIPIVWWASGTESFQRTYPRLPAAATDMELYLLYEGLYLFKWMAWEFFFRGFMLFGFEKDMRGKATLLSTVPFVLMHIGKPELEMAGAVAAGFILCFISLRSRSIWPGVFLHSMVASTMDFFASDWWR